jgi:hypothetical protein
VFSALVVVSGVSTRSSDSTRGIFARLRSGQITINEFIRIARGVGPAEFDRGLLSSTESKIRAAFSAEKMMVDLSGFDLVEVTDADGWVRARIDYRGKLKEGRDERPFSAQAVTYFHANGVANVEATCFSDVADCAQVPQLLASSEQSLATRLTTSSLEGVLPPGGTCSVEDEVTNDRILPIQTCLYAEGLVLVLARMGIPESVAALESALKADPKLWRYLSR